MRVLVTGGAGYIGSHTCKALAKEGHEPIVFDNLLTGHRSAVRWGPFELGDINDPASLRAAFDKWRPDAVIHFAARAYVGESMVAPELYYRTNVIGSLNLLDAMREAGCKTIVFSSTCAIYGVPDTLPIHEDTKRAPVNPYGRSKLMVETFLADYQMAHGINYVALRYFNAAGADPEGEIGEDHDPETHLIPLVLQVAAGLRPHITIFGTNYSTPDGTCVRDYVHVADLATAHVKALQFCTESRSGVFNLGNGQGFSVREIIAAVEQGLGRNIPLVFGEPRPGDPAELIADATSARSSLNWQPVYSRLEEMIDHAWRWQARCQNNG